MHHYLPQCYLKNFSIDVKQKQIFVVDALRKKSFTSNIKNVAMERDFNRTDFEDVDNYFIEKELSKFESGLASALKNIAQGGAFINQTKDYILNFIALLSVRTPLMRAHFTNMHSTAIERVMDISLSSEKRWEQIQEKYSSEERIGYKEAKEFYESKKYKITVDQDYLIQSEFKLASTILSCLYPRNWQLITTTANDDLFLTSDHPVSLRWDYPDKIPAIFRHSPGFAVRDTTVYFPLTKHHYLVGRFDKPDGYIDGNKDLVMASNSQTISFSQAQVFSPEKSILLLAEDSKTIRLDSIFPE
jgi:hypothetical protein